MEEEVGQSSGDEAPETISQSQAKSKVQQDRKLEHEAIKKQKDAKKDARRKRQSEIVEQKKAKKKSRTLERLPDEIIKILASVDQEKEKMKNIVSNTEESRNMEMSIKSKNKPTKNKETRQNKLKTKPRPSANKKDIKLTGKRRGKQQKLRKVVCVLNEKYKPKESKAEKGKKFLREQLYGSRIKRIDSISARSAKTIGISRPKVNF